MAAPRDTLSLTVITKDVQSSHTPNSSSLSIIASRTTSSDDIIRISLDRLQVYEDSSLFCLVCLDKNGDITHAFSPSDYPLVTMETDVKVGVAKTLHVRKRSSASSTLLSSFTESLSGLTSTDSLEALVQIDDLCKLEDLTEDLMLSILKSRFDSNRIYTYVGSILIAINPYYFYSIYNPKYCSLYQGKHLGELPPHIFAIADDSYSSMLADKIDQAVIISGESGAGKTESTKFLLHQLMQLSAKYEETSSLDLITLGTGPVLEAFGNAKTIANNNSSRFGKFILVKFKENGAYFGASIEKYLLEKSRIISQAPGERNYHVFYYLLSGADADLKTKLHLLSLDEYRYLQSSGASELEGGGGEEAAEFHRLKESLRMLKFTGEIQDSMFTVLSAILHIGNIKFEKISGGEKAQVSNLKTVQIISTLLQVDQDILLEALVTRKSKAGGMDTFVTHYKLDEAVATCDAMAKALYGALFDWIVDKVNRALVGQFAKGSHKGNTIGVLDIFGFEVFPKNSFEQFCINYANEQLQQYFNKHIFKLEQVEYQSEGIEWRSVRFEDNSDCIDLIAKKPTGLLPLLDEECSFPGADDLSLFEKFERQHKGSSTHYSSPQLKRKEPVFTISHYASLVTYSIQGFREKNRDLMRQDVVEVLKTSRMNLVRSLIGLRSYAVHRWRLAAATVLGVVRFIWSGRRRRRRQQEEDDYNLATSYSRKKRPVSSPPVSPSHESKSSSMQRVLSAGNVLGGVSTDDKGTGTSKVKAGGQRLSAVQEPAGKDDTDSVPLQQLSSPHSSADRHPSIAHLFKKKWHHSLRAKMEGKNEREDLGLLMATGGLIMGGAGGVASNKDKIYRSAPRVKIDSSRTSCGKLQQLAGTGSSRRGQTKTVSAEFHTSLVYLMEQLERTHPYFIRCIKSNGVKASRQFDSELVTRQLRYTGMMETIRIRKAGFSVRMSFEDFYEKYQFLIGRKDQDLANQIRGFLETLGFSNNDVQIGNTKVFMRDRQKHTLQDLLEEKVLNKIIVIQRWTRAKLHRCRFLQMRRTVLLIQRYSRGFLSRQNYSNYRQRVCSSVIIQSFWRTYFHRKRFLLLREAAVLFQAHWRGKAARMTYYTALERERDRKRLLEEEAKENERIRIERERKMAEEEQSLLSDLESLETEILQQEKEKDASLVLADIDTLLSTTDNDKRAETTPTKTVATPTLATPITEVTSPPATEPTSVDSEFNKNSEEIPPTGSAQVTGIIDQFSGNHDNKPHPVKLSRKAPIGRVKSPFLEKENRQSVTPSPEPLKGNISPEPLQGGSENIVVMKDDVPLVTKELPVVIETRTTPLKEAPAVRKKPQRWKVQNKTGGHTPSGHAPKPPDDLLLDSLSDEDLDSTVTMTTEEGVASNKETPPTKRGITRSLGDATELDNEAPPTSSSTLTTSLHLSEALKSRSFDESCEFTRGLSPDDMYHANYQLRHTGDTPTGEREEELARENSKESRFVVNRKRWGRRSPKLKGPKKETGGHPLLSKIQRITSPSASGENTPHLGLSPSKKPPNVSKPSSHSYKTSSMNKSLVCLVCSKGFSGFLKQGSKCVTCGIVVHKHCHDRAPPCNDPARPGQQVVMATEVVVSDNDELDELSRFLVEKHVQLVHKMAQVTPDHIEPLDNIFQKSLCEFQFNLVSNYSLSVQQQDSSDTNGHTTASSPPKNIDSASSTKNSPVTYTMDNLVNKFSSIYRSMGHNENLPLHSSDVAIGVNHIRTLLDEFVKSRQYRVRVLSNDSKMRPTKMKRRKSTAAKEVHFRTHKGHKFVLTQFNVRTVCDQCSVLIPVLAKGEMCQECSYACHEYCTKKVSLKCEGKGWRGGGGGAKVSNEVSSKSRFGVPLERLVPAGATKVPTFLEKCFICIENNGLYTQGIYRRSAGGSSKRSVREALENDPEGVDLDNFSLYAVAATITSFFRELPEPLLTRHLYNDFIRATDLSDPSDMMETLHRIIDRLPDMNHCVFERLIFNLARVAQQGAVNKMDPHNLAIIFAPSLLQGDNTSNPDQLLKMMPKQTKVIESIINEQVDKLAVTLKDIHDLTSVARTAANRLSKLQEDNKENVKSPTPLKKNMESLEEKKDNEKKTHQLENGSQQEESRCISEKERLKNELKLIERDRAVLTASLPKLEPFPSHTLNRRSETYPSSSHSASTSNGGQTNATITGTGREEFLKRQLMFAGGEEGVHRSPCVIKIETEETENPSVPVQEEPAATDTVEEKELVEENEQENEAEGRDSLPDLPAAVTLSSLTKNRVTQKPFAKRRPPTRHHLIDQSNLTNNEDSIQ